MDASKAEKNRERCGRFFPHTKHCAGTVPTARAVLAAVLLALWACAALAGSGPVLELPTLWAPGHPGWKAKSFAGQTAYTPVPAEGLLLAESNASASGLFFERSVDLRATPWLNWTWKAGNVLANVNEREKAGDDYPARVYVVAKGGLAFWKTRALSYVWASAEPEGTMWPNAFTSNAHMIAIRSGPTRLGELLTERRNVREDWRRAFGEDIETLDAVAIMTDTDNSGQRARAWYGRVWFSGE